MQDKTYLETNLKQRAINNQKAIEQMNQDPTQSEYDEIVLNLLRAGRYSRY